MVGARHFQVLVAGRWLSQTSDGLLQAALAGYLLFNPNKSANAGELAALLAVTLVPYSALGPFVGVFIDRWKRQPLVVWVPFGRALASLAVAGMLAAGSTGPLLYTVVLVSLSANRFYLATQGASLPHVVPRDALLTGNAIASTGGTIVAYFGGTIGLAFGRGGGAVACEVVSAALYFAAALVPLLLPRGLLGPDQPVAGRLGAAIAEVWRELCEGAVATIRSRATASALGAITVTRFLVSLLFVAIIFVYRYVLHTGSEGLAGALGAAGVGTVLAAFVTPRLGRLVGKRAIIFGNLLVSGLAVPLLVPPLRPLLLAVAGLFIGLTSASTKIAVDTTVQENLPDRVRGRAFAIYDTLYNVSFVVAALVVAVALPRSGRSTLADFVVGAAYVATALAFWVVSRPAPA